MFTHLKPQRKHLLLAMTLLFACSKFENPLPPVPNAPSLSIEIQHFAGTAPFSLYTDFLTLNGDTVKAERFAYYLSNVVLYTSPTDSVLVKDSYYLVRVDDQTGSNYSIEIKNLPPVTIEKIGFSIGVDPLKNASTDNDGDLDPNNFMAWNWDTGYKFLLFEGRFRNADGLKDALVLHIGGNSNFQTMRFPLNTPVELKENTQPKVVFKAQIKEIFENPNTIALNESTSVVMGPGSELFAQNYAHMFTLEN